MQKGFIVFLLMGIFIISFSGSVFAVPNITFASGTILDGQSVVISGSGFGVKSTATPLIFDNFESGTIGTAIYGQPTSHAGQWQDYFWDAIPVYSDENLRQGTITNAKFPLRVNALENHAPLRYKHPSPGFEDVYMSFWMRWDWGDVVDFNAYQIKFWSIGGLDVGSITSGPQVYSDRHYSGGSAFELWSDNSDQINVCNGVYSQPFQPERWVKIEYQGKFIQDNTGSSESWVFYNPGVSLPIKEHDCHEIQTIAVGETEIVDVAMIGWYLTNSDDPDGNHGADLYYDDIYIDNTWSRVMIGDNLNFDSSTHREIQIPTAWVDGSITIDVNQGSFVDGEDVYLFVVDENGGVSNGYLVTLGAGLSNCGDADSNPVDDVVSITELINYISQWKAGNVNIGDLITAIGEWKNGCV